MKSPQNHFCPFWSLSNFTLPNMSKCSQTLWACSNGLIIYLDQIAQVGKMLYWSNCPKPLPVQNQIWTTLHCQVCPFDLNFCGHVQILKWWHYTKWCIKENRFAWLILEKPFLLISRDYQSYIGHFAQMSSNLVEHPNYMFHFTLLIIMSSGIHLLDQTSIKHLLAECQNACFNPFH